VFSLCTTLSKEKAMSMQKVSVMVPPLRTVPRGAVWFGDAVSWLFGGDPRVRKGFSAWIAVARAARQEASSRAALIALATRYQATQPEFAKDLFAAANNDRD
jgi:hypothetical protein